MTINKRRIKDTAGVISPLTACTDTILLHTFESEKIISDWEKTFKIDISSEFLDETNIDLFKCKQTGLIFFHPASTAGSSQLYEQLQKFDWFYMPEKWEHLIALQDLKNCEKVLEVGAATGHFIRQGVKQGLNMTGLELNEKAAMEAQSKGLAVECTPLDELLKKECNQYDAVCSFQVLEHIAEPRQFIEQCIESVKVGGIIIFSVPNADSFLKHQYNLLDMPPHHMTRWTENVFKSLENLFPIRLEKVQLEPLASYHAKAYLAAYSEHLRQSTWYGRLLFNRITLPTLDKIISFPWVRQRLVGQSLYVQFEKLK